MHGITSKAAGCQTPHGTVWITQRNQVALLRSGEDRVHIISRNYQSLLSGKTVRFIVYVSDPLNEVDRVEIYFTDGTSVVHDFQLANERMPWGQAYTATGQDYTAGATLKDASGNDYHIVAERHLYTREGQPDESGAIVTYDESFDESQVKSKANFSGQYERHWDDFGDDSIRKTLGDVDAVCDDQTILKYYFDNELVNDSQAKRAEGPNRVDFSQTHSSFRFKLSKPIRYAFKLVFSLTGNYSRGLTYNHPSGEGSLAANFIGSIVKLKMWVTAQGNVRG